MEEWATYKLGEIAECSLGKMLDQRKNKGKPRTYLGNVAVRWGSFNIDPTQTMLFEDHELEKYSLKKNDIVICEGGEPGRCAIWKSNDTILIQKALHRVRVNAEIADPLYVYYYITHLAKSHQLEPLFTGSTIKHLPRERLVSIDIRLPDLSTQKQISSILAVIDDKRHTNSLINDNLEQQAQALYKSWFVDFEPFCEGEFIESSLGSIPAGWKVGQLSDICEIVGGGTPSKSHPEYYCKRGIAWITPKDLSVSKSKFSSRGSEDITSDGYKNSSAKLMPRGTVLFSSRAPIGYISIATNEICTNQGFKSAVPGIAGTGYLYYFLQANTDKIESKASGSTFKEASGSLMKALEVIIPEDGIFNQFEAELAPILNKQENIASEIQTLTTLRDTILPKLMSGELKINEIDC